MITITIKTGNAAFQDDNKNYELARILKEVVKKLENGYSLEDINIMDINGNCVGNIETE
jgi:type II secretory pathway component PulF